MAAATVSIQDFPRQYSDLVEKLWDHQELLASLQLNPVRVLLAEGIGVPEGATVNVVLRKLEENSKLSEQIRLWEEGLTTGVFDLIIPIKPNANAELFGEAGINVSCCSCPCCCC